MKFQTQHTQRMQHNICTVTRFYHYYNSELLLLLFIGGPQIMRLSVFLCLRKRDLYPISSISPLFKHVLTQIKNPVCTNKIALLNIQTWLT